MGGLTHGDGFDFNIYAVTAPTAAGVYPFVVKSAGTALSDSDGNPAPVNLSVSNKGPGSGSGTVSPDSVRAASSSQILTFTFTAAETMTKGEIRLTIPSGWTAPDHEADGIDNDSDGNVDEVGEEGETLNLANVATGDDDEVVFAAPIGQTIIATGVDLTRGQTVKFSWTGTVQANAAGVTFPIQSKLDIAG